MSVTTTTNKVLLNGDAVTVAFGFPYLFFEDTNLLVYVNDINGVPILKTIGVHYTVSGAGSVSGGTITFTLGNTPPAGVKNVIIIRDLPILQPTTYPENNKFPAISHERALDRVTMIVQQLAERIGRQPVLPVSWPGGTIELPYGPTVAGYSFRWNGTGDALELFLPSSAGVYADPITTKGDVLVGNAAGLSSRKGVGADFTIFEADSAQTNGLAWTSLATVLGRMLTTRGDILTRDAGGVVRKAKGARGTLFTFDANDPLYLAKGARGGLVSYDANDVITLAAGAKGGVLTPDANADLGYVAVGADGTALVARAGATRGAEYAKVGLAQDFHGLHAKTGPDNDVRKTTISLLNLRSAVMSDGTRYDDVVREGTDTPLTAVITTAGAGGLDTGAEANAWYSWHLIGKSSSKSNSDLRLLLHRAPDFFKDEEQATDDTSRALRLLTATATDKIAQGIKVDTTGKMPFVELKLRRVGAVSGDIWVTIEGDNAGSPDGTPIGTSEKIDAGNHISSNGAQWILFRFFVRPNLTATTQYHVVLQGNYAKSDTIFIQWQGVVAGGYANGVSKDYNGTTWSATAGGSGLDRGFRAFIVRNDAALTFPSGYDQECLLGYVLNDATPDFEAFEQINRYVKPLINRNRTDGSGTFLRPDLLDFATWVPPVSVLAHMSIKDTVGATSVRVAQTPEGGAEISTGSAGFGFGNGYATTQGAEGSEVHPTVMIHCQRAFFAGSGATTSIHLMGWE